MRTFQIEQHHVVLGLVQGLCIWAVGGSLLGSLGYAAAFTLGFAWVTKP